MEYFKASREHGELIFNLVQDTINAVYPRYYPKPVVEFFCGIHSRDNINRDIEEGCVRVLWKDGRLVGTGSRKGNHITRVFVAPELQGQGCGSCPQPHHDGGHGDGVQGYHDAGEVSWRDLAS